MEIAISYRTDLAKKNVDFLKNPKGYNVVHMLDKKIIIGRNLKDEKDRIEFIRQFQILNPKFPITNLMNSNSTKLPTVQKPVTQSAPSAPIIQNPVKVSETITETIKNTDYTLVYLGIAGILAFIFLQNKGKRK